MSEHFKLSDERLCTEPLYRKLFEQKFPFFNKSASWWVVEKILTHINEFDNSSDRRQFARDVMNKKSENTASEAFINEIIECFDK